METTRSSTPSASIRADLGGLARGPRGGRIKHFAMVIATVLLVTGAPAFAESRGLLVSQACSVAGVILEVKYLTFHNEWKERAFHVKGKGDKRLMRSGIHGLVVQFRMRLKGSSEWADWEGPQVAKLEGPDGWHLYWDPPTPFFRGDVDWDACARKPSDEDAVVRRRSPVWNDPDRYRSAFDPPL